ncbi:MAG TPA: autorepressor SdpR family transcription factor [Thermomicrobiaceae bacterium]|nr:autorepressor SdpR family transcription factor [Thermomicrobiaceae bacterium]
MDAVFRALSDPKRRAILRLLRERDFSAGELAERFAVARSTLSGHLSVLREAGLVVTERQGTTIVYSLNLAVYEELLAAVLELLGVGAREGARHEDHSPQ